MSLITMKIGGTSIGGAARMRQVGAIVERTARGDAVAVVVSTMAGAADLIFRSLQGAIAGTRAGGAPA